jgi:ATP-dependent DNA helicase RecQ
VVVHGNDRPNLFYEVRRVEDESSDRRVLRELLVERSADGYPDDLADRLAAVADGAGIVYTQTTRAANETAGWLRAWGIAAEAYHGRMRKAERERVQDGFMAGAVRVVCATNAFGLGVDKPDVRFVVHRDIPASVEAYMQEAGRAGRDGGLARCTLIFRPGDLGRAAFLGATARLEPADVAAARDALAGGGSLTRRELARASGLGRGELARVVDLLREEGLVRERRRRLSLVRDFDAADVPLDAEERRRAYERSRLDMMRGYAETAACRREFLLNYVGEEYDADRCALCDNHATRGRRAVGRRADVPFAVGDRVRHAEWGEGVVHRVGAEKVTVLFDSEGWKTLAADLVGDGELLVPVGG